MRRRNPDDESLGERKADVTREVTGEDAARDDAEIGSAGNGDFRWGKDDIEDQYRLEPDPGHPEDLGPDQIERGVSDPDEEDRELDARPSDHTRPNALGRSRHRPAV